MKRLIPIPPNGGGFKKIQDDFPARPEKTFVYLREYEENGEKPLDSLPEQVMPELVIQDKVKNIRMPSSVVELSQEEMNRYKPVPSQLGPSPEILKTSNEKNDAHQPIDLPGRDGEPCQPIDVSGPLLEESINGNHPSSTFENLGDFLLLKENSAFVDETEFKSESDNWVETCVLFILELVDLLTEPD